MNSGDQNHITSQNQQTNNDLLSSNKKLVDFTTLNEMLYGESSYIKEFADAALSSFGEFKENYCEYLKKRDEVNFRKAGHKIKPVAQMLGLEVIIDEYEQAKMLIWDQKEDKELDASCEKMSSICDQVLKELKELSA